MPELPEVETTKRGIASYLTGQVIANSHVRIAKLRWPISDEIYQLNNVTILSVQRRAKYILIETDQGWLVIHLGMSGSLRILTTAQPYQKHDHIDLCLRNGVILRYTDPRRFGCWLWFSSLSACRLLQQLGPEPLSDDFHGDYLYQCAKGKSSPIKSWIMDNKVVVGVGNIYANEALFIAKILPMRPASSLSHTEMVALVAAIKSILHKAIEKGGTTLKDFVNSEGKPGYFAQFLRVYKRAGEPCVQCQTPIKVIKIGQRSSFYCDNCQH